MSGEQSSDIPFESTQGDISDIEDQSIASSVPTSAPLPIANVNTPTISNIQPTAVLSSPLTLFGLSTMSTTNTVTLVDGYKVKVAATPKTIDANTEYIQISSADRVLLTQKEQTDVRNAITKKQYSLFDKMDLTSTDLKQLVGFQTNLVAAERHFAKYDLRQIFMIVEPERDADGRILSTLKAGSTQLSNLRKCLSVTTGGISTPKTIGSTKIWASPMST
jgi:hypothetical protein